MASLNLQPDPMIDMTSHSSIRYAFQNMQKSRKTMHDLLETLKNSVDFLFIQENPIHFVRKVPSTTSELGDDLIGPVIHRSWQCVDNRSVHPQSQVAIYVNVRFTSSYQLFPVFNPAIDPNVLVLCVCHNQKRSDFFHLINIYNQPGTWHSTVESLLRIALTLANLAIVQGDFNLHLPLWDPAISHVSGLGKRLFYSFSDLELNLTNDEGDATIASLSLTTITSPPFRHFRLPLPFAIHPFLVPTTLQLSRLSSYGSRRLLDDYAAYDVNKNPRLATVAATVIEFDDCSYQESINKSKIKSKMALEDFLRRQQAEDDSFAPEAIDLPLPPPSAADFPPLAPLAPKLTKAERATQAKINALLAPAIPAVNPPVKQLEAPAPKVPSSPKAAIASETPIRKTLKRPMAKTPIEQLGSVPTSTSPSPSPLPKVSPSASPDCIPSPVTPILAVATLQHYMLRMPYDVHSARRETHEVQRVPSLGLRP
ncbi:hypothetical protein AX14_005823 [Amanita brunnescens Koide BX004]|nr:hypothetical protein AX14_005823 [Amanita brunnescens Koide BX004]